VWYVYAMMMRRIVHIAAGVALLGALAACSGGGSEASKSTTSATTSTAASTTTTSAVAASPTTPAPGSPAALLAATPWETTGAKDAQGASVPLTDDQVKSFVGFAYFMPDGTFTMFNLDGSPKMHGDWSVSADGKSRTIVAKDDAGQEKFRRDVDIITLTDQEFTYRVYPDAANQAVYFDIVHTPTDHPAPSQ
jgi:hypothetical protein